MFLSLVLITVLLSLKFADWKNWQKYQSTMLLFAFGNMLNNFVYHDHSLWKFNPDFFCHHIIEVIFSVTVFPLTALIFLSNYPYGQKKQYAYNLKYIFIYIFIEFILLKIGRIEYGYGWSIWYSLAWDFAMFPIFAIHHKKPAHAYFIGVLLFFLMNTLFPFKLD